MAKYLREIQQHCTALREVLLDTHVITEEEIAPFWPGGARNENKRSFASWRYTLFNLARFSARAEARQEYQSGFSPARSETLLAIQAGEPTVVALATPIVFEGVERTAFTLPFKSWSALRVLASMARIGVNLMIQAEAFYHDGTLADLVREIDEWRERIELTLVWAAISDAPDGAGYGLPWDPRRVRWPEPPTELQALMTADRLAIHAAWMQQHAQALLAITPFMLPESGESDPLSGWETFFGSYANDKGHTAQQLMQDRAFLPFLTTVTVAADAARRAREAAKDKPTTPPNMVTA